VTNWLTWIRYRLFGGPPPGQLARDTDPDILEIRQRQHAQSNELTRRGLQDEWSRMQRDAWREGRGRS
jgi:hypothetical protein